MADKQATNNPFGALFADIEVQLLSPFFAKGKIAAVERLKRAAAGRQLVIYGCGTTGRDLFYVLAEEGVPVNAFGDTYREGTFLGREIMRPAELRRKCPDAVIAITLALPAVRQEIAAALKDAGFPEDSLVPCVVFPWERCLESRKIACAEFREKHFAGYEWAYGFFRDDISKEIIVNRSKACLLGRLEQEASPSQMYFEKEIIRLAEGETFLDGGCFDGDSAAEFIRQMRAAGKEYGHIYGFEPDGRLYQKACERLRGERATVLPKGLWSSDGELTFYIEREASSTFVATVATSVTPNAFAVPVVSLDSFFAGFPEEKLPTFIKYDIEGAEKEALLGAAGIIGKKRPKLAICVYHKPEDIYELPRLVWEINTGYEFALRHYGEGGCLYDTVMYAVAGREG
jgi:FkbM family methyltransferase